ncbi:hypothetical protein GCM10009092_11450 [Bowmanella denitrificans]|uniref:N-acetyltransferase domain-containing protein n=1 Tax=Bowmanella denitrificans TaxID=366582 RepID=A0ABN0WWV8_9ALTE
MLEWISFALLVTTGQGIATQLLINCLGQAEKKHARVVLIERHEENLASAGMMKKAGFYIIDRFYDPDKRESGSRCSVIFQKDILPE